MDIIKIVLKILYMLAFKSFLIVRLYIVLNDYLRIRRKTYNYCGGIKMLLPKRINPIIKLTERCNYACEFCRYAIHRQEDSGIEEDLLLKMIRQCISYNKMNGSYNMNVIFHGGEPLLYGRERLLSVLEEISKELDSEFAIEYSIQTNSSLITDEWIKVFKEYNFDVGISLDGPESLNGHFGNNREKAVYDALEIYKKMKNMGIHCGFLSVITDKHLENLEEFYNFIIDSEIESIGLCYCYNKFDNDSVNPVKLGEWLVELYELYFNAPKRIRIREFDLTTRRILKHPLNACSMSFREGCGNYITITPDGTLEFCDDYDLDNGRKNSLGNLRDKSLLQILQSEQYQRMKKESLDIIENKCKDCNVYELCRGGCSRNDIKDGNFFCETYRIIYTHIQNKVLNYLDKRG